MGKVPPPFPKISHLFSMIIRKSHRKTYRKSLERSQKAPRNDPKKCLKNELKKAPQFAPRFRPALRGVGLLMWWRFVLPLVVCFWFLLLVACFGVFLVRPCACLWCSWVFGCSWCFSWLWCVVFGVFLFGAFWFGVWCAVFGSFSCVWRGVSCFLECLPSGCPFMP